MEGKRLQWIPFLFFSSVQYFLWFFLACFSFRNKEKKIVYKFLFLFFFLFVSFFLPDGIASSSTCPHPHWERNSMQHSLRSFRSLDPIKRLNTGCAQAVRQQPRAHRFLQIKSHFSFLYFSISFSCFSFFFCFKSFTHYLRMCKHQPV